jgi:hypothetical protein
MDKRTKTTRQTMTIQWTKEQRQPDKQWPHNGQKNKDNQTNSDHTMDKRTKTTRQTVTIQWTKEHRPQDKQWPHNGQKNNDNQTNRDHTMDKRTKTTRQTVTTQWTKEQRQPDKQWPHNGQKNNDNQTNGDPQNATQKTQYWERHAFGSKEVHYKVFPLSFFYIANSSLQKWLIIFNIVKTIIFCHVNGI